MYKRELGNRVERQRDKYRQRQKGWVRDRQTDTEIDVEKVRL